MFAVRDRNLIFRFMFVCFLGKRKGSIVVSTNCQKCLFTQNRKCMERKREFNALRGGKEIPTRRENVERKNPRMLWR